MGTSGSDGPIPDRPRVVAILGPTASGKTQLAVCLAKELGGELVNADSRQGIRELTIGVCQPTAAELQGVTCHGLDWSHLGDPFSAAEYRVKATAAVEAIASRKRPAIVVGGTGFYIRSLLGGFDFGGVAPEARRTDSASGPDDPPSLAAAAAAELERLDPERAREVDQSNPRRVIRAVELARAGARASQLPPEWSVVKLGCHVGTGLLRDRIEARSERLVADPFREEVESLLSRGFSAELLARTAIGYSEVIDWAQGRCTRGEAVGRVIARTWRYAKAQWTWLRTEPDLQWVDAAVSPAEVTSQCLTAIDRGWTSRVR